MIDKCKDCSAPIDTSLIEEGEIVTCVQCGCEYYWKNGNLVYIELDGDDSWGE